MWGIYNYNKAILISTKIALEKDGQRIISCSLSLPLSLSLSLSLPLFLRAINVEKYNEKTGNVTSALLRVYFIRNVFPQVRARIFAEDVPRSIENWSRISHDTYGEGKKNIFSSGWLGGRDSQATSLVADSLQRNPWTTWASTRPIKMRAALYIERDRSHDTPCASPMGIFYRGEFVHTSANARVCVRASDIRSCACACVSRGWF